MIAIMRRTICLLLLSALGLAVFAQQPRPWRHLVDATGEEAFRNFQTPPPEYGLVMWWFWNSSMTEEEITHDLRDMHDHQIHSVMLWAYYGLGIQYLSPEWFERVHFAVKEARRLDMRVWLMDEGSYPSGFVGGIISKSYPESRMQVLAAAPPESVASGTTIARELPPATLAVIATDKVSGRSLLLPGAEGKFQWTAPAGEWTVTVVRHEFRTSPTRYVNNPGFKKDSTYSFLDPLDPKATGIFLRYVHEEYKKAIGDEFGKTVLGFMGDEPSVAGMPWTAALMDEFERRKGYDLRPYLAGLLARDSSSTARRVRADYWDVWTDLYSENFFKPQTDWCERNGLDYIVHLCGEEDLKSLIGLDGDYFKVNRTVQTPGVDAIWRQIWPGTRADYPKLASSSAHLRGRPRAFTESFAVYGQGLSLEQAKWVIDYQMARGVNHFQTMEYLSSNAEFRQYFHPPNWAGSTQWAQFPLLATYTNRLSYLLSVGRPAAQIAVYYPTTSGWMGDFDADKSALSLAAALIQGQRDFDFIDEDNLREPAAVRDGALWNRSGQGYRAVIVPAVTALSEGALATLEKLERVGGKVIFLGKLPSLAPGRTFLDASAPAMKGRAMDLASAISQLPEPDLKLTPAAPSVSYLHRKLKDADVYFLFNESEASLTLTASFQGKGDPEIWDPLTGVREPLGTSLTFEPFGTRLVVLSGRSVARRTESAPAEPLTTLDGDWELRLGPDTLTTPLRRWSGLGHEAFWGTGVYRKDFELASVSSNLAIDLGEVKYSARVRLNGHDLGPIAWRPFRWDISRYARVGVNHLEVEVTNTRANELAADEARYREIEGRGWFTNSYIGMYLKFDREMIPSGLIGPVRIMTTQE